MNASFLSTRAKVALSVTTLTTLVLACSAWAQVLVVPEVVANPSVPHGVAPTPEAESGSDKTRCQAPLVNILGKWQSKGSSSPYETIEIQQINEQNVFKAKAKPRKDVRERMLDGSWEYRNCRLQVFLPDEDASYEVLVLPQATHGPMTGPSLSLKKMGDNFRIPYTRAIH